MGGSSYLARLRRRRWAQLYKLRRAMRREKRTEERANEDLVWVSPAPNWVHVQMYASTNTHRINDPSPQLTLPRTLPSHLRRHSFFFSLSLLHRVQFPRGPLRGGSASLGPASGAGERVWSDFLWKPWAPTQGLGTHRPQPGPPRRRDVVGNCVAPAPSLSVKSRKKKLGPAPPFRRLH